MGDIDDLGRQELAWKEMVRSHGGDMEDALLQAAADFERENPPSVDLTRPTYDQVRNIPGKTGFTIQFVDPVNPTTEMQYIRVKTEDGDVIEGFIPAVIPEDGLKVLINGVRGIFYIHPENNEVALDETEPAPEDDEQKHLMEMSKVEAKIVGYNPMAERQLYGVSISDEFALSLMEAWEHVGHGGECQEVANTYLSRFMEQLVGALHVGNANKGKM